ncbi:hypothetical protein Rsub_10489 [Raphidocelis subcapitata]|uniref:Bardet-Biedl syndrome 7 n=1 Tax=Raphidocelis subcapitata TaxID=307507 RepID=A0A2V0PF05_9CHLO|nr:hypothetical protein Rsub_10489 [Raphidocelis subcapitata]|eukprot:GBF98424.1 hypothetical protein Rsub_10489 [Raphidocelis subcapitata]
MELELHRVDLLQTAAAAPGTLVVLPPGEKKTQKVAVGDCSGVVQCFSVKRGEVALAFKTMPGPHKVTSVSLGRHPRQRDKIFVASGGLIRGMTKKGKEFFRFTTALTEPIARLAVADRDIWASCEYIIPLHGPQSFAPVLACRDCVVRVLDAAGRAPLFEVPAPSPPTALLHVADSHDPRHRFPAGSIELLYGCEDGRVVQLAVEPGAVRQGFTIPPPPGGGAVRALHCGADYSRSGCADIVVGREDGWLEVFATQLPESICAVDGGYITGASAPEIVVITFSPSPAALALGAAGPAAPPAGAAPFRDGARRTSSSGLSPAASGLPGAASGLASGLQAPAAQQQAIVAALHARIQKATAEVEGLKKRVERERARAGSRGAGAAALAAASAPGALLNVSHSLKLQLPAAAAATGAAAASWGAAGQGQQQWGTHDASSAGAGGWAGPGSGSGGSGGGGGGAAYVLAIESAAPLFAVGLACTRELELLDAPGNVAILSRTPPEGGPGGWATLATYRCQDATNRLAVSFRLPEGAPGLLQAFVVPAAPPKACGVVQYRLVPLCLHQRISADVLEMAAAAASAAAAGGGGSTVVEGSGQRQLPFSELTISGGFSLAEAHAWAAAALPDLPPHPPTAAGSGGSGGGEVRYSFRSCQAGSLLGCSLSAGAIRFVSDNISALALAHDSVMRSAAADKARASSSFSLHPAALDHAAALLWPELELQRARARRAKLLAALQELRAQDGDVGYLSNEYRGMLEAEGGAGTGAGAAGQQGTAGQRGAGAGGAADAAAARGLAAAQEALRQLFRDHCRLAGGGGGGGGGAAARAAGLDALLARAGDAGAGLADVVAYMRG